MLTSLYITPRAPNVHTAGSTARREVSAALKPSKQALRRPSLCSAPHNPLPQNSHWPPSSTLNNNDDDHFNNNNTYKYFYVQHHTPPGQPPATRGNSVPEMWLIKTEMCDTGEVTSQVIWTSNHYVTHLKQMWYYMSTLTEKLKIEMCYNCIH